MQETTGELNTVLSEALEGFAGISTAQWRYKPDAGRWSRQEILGHLIDSAQNNLRRFVVAQYEDRPRIVYRQNHWVQAQGYQEAPIEDLIQTWRLLNRQIVRTLETLPATLADRPCDIGQETPEIHPISWVAADYVRHLRHHLNQIFHP
jgi:hypothetical protein